MGLFDFLRRKDEGYDVAELARRVGLSEDELRSVPVTYHEHRIPKRSGRGVRTLQIPNPDLKRVQRRLNRRLLALLVAHPAVHGFERGRSIVTHARAHAGQACVLRLDIKDFFGSTKPKRVKKFFRTIGWNRDATSVLLRLCVHNKGLPQGAPTSPRLANVVNYLMDHRLTQLATGFGGRYTRYADDLTLSFARPHSGSICPDLWGIVYDFGYTLNDRKTRMRYAHQRQHVTGLVVNDRVNLPRETRRKLRAIEHHLATGRQATMTPEQLDGWKALQHMIETQR